MSQDIEWLESRLNNIRSAEPLLGALRTISMGSWQMARRKKESVQRYAGRLETLLTWLVPHLSKERGRRRGHRRGRNLPPESAAAGRSVLLVVGSERGLVGSFNRLLAERALALLPEGQDGPAGEGEIELWLLGTRPARILERAGRPPDHSRALPAATMPPYRLADTLTRRWLARYEAGQIDGASVLYNTYGGPGQYSPRRVRLVPPRIELGTGEASSAGRPAAGGPAGEPWPPPIVETDPLGLYAQIVRQLAAIGLYGLLLESATAEHSARYQLMEDATQNAERLIDELTLEMRQAQRQAITQEMQQLVAGAGLLRTG